MAQDPGFDEEESGGVDPSPDLDLVTLFRSSNTDAEMEANNIHGMLQASGIPSVVEGTSVIPSLEFQVLVPRENAEEADRAFHRHHDPRRRLALSDECVDRFHGFER